TWRGCRRWRCRAASEPTGYPSRCKLSGRPSARRKCCRRRIRTSSSRGRRAPGGPGGPARRSTSMSVEAAVKPTTEYEVIIGLEIHAELLTDAKVFCGCSTKFGAEPNTQICPVCLGLPGTLPVLNRKAVEYAIKAGLALNCEIAPMARFDRKHYFYPDLPKAYQITQYAEPLCRHGYVEFELNGETRRVRIRHIHLEEEAGKLQHAGDRLMEAEYSLVDYNRGGIPLIEIVTEPDIRSPEEARVFLETLRSILRYAGVSDCKMEEGSLRCDANISLRPK